MVATARGSDGRRVSSTSWTLPTTCAGRCARRAPGVGGDRATRCATPTRRQSALPLPDDELARSRVRCRAGAGRARAGLGGDGGVVAGPGDAAGRQLDPRRVLGHHRAEARTSAACAPPSASTARSSSGLQEGVLVVDTDARVVVANEAAASCSGCRSTSSRTPAERACRSTCSTTAGTCWPTDRLPLMRALRGEEVTGHGRALRAPRRLAAVGRGARQPAASTTTGCSTARSPPTTTSPRAWSRTGARARRPTPTR